MSEVCKTEPIVEKEKSWSENLDDFIQWAASCRMDQSGEISLDDKPELYKEVKKYEKLHKLGESDNTDNILPILDSKNSNNDKYYVVTGSVDRTTFKPERKRNDQFYKDINGAAQDLAESWNTIDMDFPSLKEQPELKQRMFDIIGAIADIPEADRTDAGFKKFVTDGAYTEEEIYGPEGALNMLLAYSRALSSSSDWLTESTLIKKVKISVAKEEGKKKKSRYTKVYEFLKPEEKKVTEEPKKPEEAKKPEEKPVEPQKAPDVPKAPEKAPETVKGLDAMVNEFGAVGFNVVWKPGAMDNMSGYSKYGKHRVSFACNSDGTYSFKVLTMPAGRTEVKGDKVTALAAKAQLDAIAQNSDVDILKAAELDLNKVIVKDPEGKILQVKVENAGEDGHKVTILGFRFQKLDGSIAGPKDVSFHAEIVRNGDTVIYKGYRLDKRALPPHNVASEFVKNSARGAFLD